MGRQRLGALALTAALVASACGVVGGGGGTYRLTAYFPRTINLFETSQVRVLGLEAGVVKEIAVEGDRIRVEMDVGDDTPVPADVRATIVPFSLIGERYVQLVPAWTEGTPQAADGAVIPMERTSVPVEPDEALGALKEFLDTLDPDGTGRLVSNLSDALEGHGESINGAIEGLATTVSALAAEDAALENLIDQFDDFTATLVTRESQLGEIMDAFAEATGVLADERESIRSLVEGLGNVSGDALGLVAEHGTSLERDLEILGRTLRSVDVHLDRVEDLLDSGPLLVTGLREAYNPEFHRTDLRNQYGPTAAQALMALGVPFADVVCLPIDVDCTPTGEAPAPVAGTSTGVAAQGATPAQPVDPAEAAVRTPRDPAPVSTPIDHILDLMGTNAAPAESPATPSGDHTSWWTRALGTILGVDW